MICPGCKKKIGFLESLTIVNPLNFKCKICSNYITLSRSSVKSYLMMLLVIFIISFLGFFQLETKRFLTKSFLLFLVPAILISVTIIHYFFWNNASAESKNPDKDGASGISC